MNGTCTLVPHKIAEALGNLDGHFRHSLGDLDYGFRARSAGFHVYLAPGYLASCAGNPQSGTWLDTQLPFGVRWRHLTSPKGAPFPAWSLYCRRHLGPLWPLYAVSPYIKTLVTSLIRSR
jgi:GT2 family glycosyltransferase